MNIGDRLRKLRIDSEMTLEDAGKKIGATKQTLYKYESGIVTNIPSDKIERLAAIYNTTPSYIMGWDESKATEKEIKLAEQYVQARKSNDPVVKALVDAIDRLLGIDE